MKESGARVAIQMGSPDRALDSSVLSQDSHLAAEVSEELPEAERDRLRVLHRELHDAAFSFLRTGARDPWDVAANEKRFRASVAAHLAGDDDGGGLAPAQQKLPEFAARLNLPAGGLGKTQIKLLFGTQQAYETYVEALALVDNVHQRESVAEKFRHQLLDNFPALSAQGTISDQIFEAELEEAALKREVARRHLGVTRADPIKVESRDERVALLAAGSMQPVLRSLIQAALKARTPLDKTTPRQLLEKAVDKRLQRPTGAQDRARHYTEEGLEALEDRARATLSLCENLQAENQERQGHKRSGGAGNAPGLKNRLAELRVFVMRLNLMTNGGEDLYPAVAYLQSAMRGLVMREREERRLHDEDCMLSTRIQMACRRAIKRFIYLSARESTRVARGALARTDYAASLVAGEQLKNGARRRRAMARLEMLRAGHTAEMLAEQEAAAREQRAREEEQARAEEQALRDQLLRDEEERKAACIAAQRRATKSIEDLEVLLAQEEAALTASGDPAAVQELRGRLEEAITAAEAENAALKAQADRVEAWAKENLSPGYLNRLLDEGPADARVAGVPVVPLNLGAAERGSSRHEVSVSRWGVRSRTGDKFRVKEKCAAAAAAFDALESLLADDAAPEEAVRAAAAAFEIAQEEAQRSIADADAEVADKGVWTDPQDVGAGKESGKEEAPREPQVGSESLDLEGGNSVASSHPLPEQQ